jgi:hypothetical protein
MPLPEIEPELRDTWEMVEVTKRGFHYRAPFQNLQTPAAEKVKRISDLAHRRNDWLSASCGDVAYVVYEVSRRLGLPVERVVGVARGLNPVEPEIEHVWLHVEGETFDPKAYSRRNVKYPCAYDQYDLYVADRGVVQRAADSFMNDTPEELEPHIAAIYKTMKEEEAACTRSES